MAADGRALEAEGSRSVRSSIPPRPNRRVPRVGGSDGTSPHAASRGIADAPSTRGRWRFVLRLLAVVAMLGGAVATGRLGVRWLHTSPTFALDAPIVTGTRHLSEAQVLAAAGVRRGTNAFAADPVVVRERLLAHPWIAEATVTRRLPRTLRIAVREHEPAALLVTSDAVYVVSAEGRPFSRVDGTRALDLPVLVGLDPARMAADRAWAGRRLAEAVSLVTMWRTRGLERRAPLEQLHLEADEGWSVHAGDGLLVRLGRAPHEADLARLVRVLDVVRARGIEPAVVFLDGERRPDRVVVRRRRPVEDAAAAPEGGRRPG
ncbi:MAG: FtsQ-type POTRA domain-containing protein [Myxococcota bacterium]|nr:FtsQ-type POTRA domain-containing protein [Myxococcota bacterium]MDW8362540.1 FtsQ-type POTRA domain-containing protein [Myxococcales bacterium]